MATRMTKRLYEIFSLIVMALWMTILLSTTVDAFSCISISRQLFGTSDTKLSQSQYYTETDDFLSDKDDLERKREDRLGLLGREISKKKKTRSIAKSNFWNVAPETRERNENDVMPCEYHLDADGPLPFGSYRLLGNPEFEPKRTCLTTIGIDVTRNAVSPFSNNVDFSEIDPDQAVTNMQSLIDSGFNSFQISHPNSPNGGRSSKKQPLVNCDWFEPSFQELWTETNIYGRLIKETPSSVISSCHFTTNLNLPPKNYEGPFGNGNFLRDMIGQKMERMGGMSDSIDTLQLCYQEDSPYCLDIMDTLFEMRREGIIRSITGRNIPRKLMEEATACGYELDSNQVSCNLLNPNPYVNHIATTGGNTNVHSNKVLVSSPLAGGLLTEAMLQNKFCCPPPYLMSQQQNWHVENTLRQWAERQYDGKPPKELRHGKFWEYFNTHFKLTLKEIAYKHGVPVSSVALRWAMQLDRMGSLVVTSGLQARGDNDRPFERPKTLRQIYSFHLDEEDMERLWQISGRIEPKNEEIEGFDGFENGFTPDFSNTKLWL